MKRFLSICLIAASAVALAGGGQFDSKRTYFNGAVLAEYHKTLCCESDDTFTLTYFEPGNYQVEFSVTPGKSVRSGKYLPKGFTAMIEHAPRGQVISQYILPSYMRVTITHNGVTESRDFQ